MIKWAILFIIAFLPPLVYVAWIRNTERYHREPWRAVFLCFFWGATIAIVASLILEIILDITLSMSIRDYSLYSLTLAVFIAPVAEEFTKPLVIGFKTVRKELDELEDGFIYGASAGLGFSATENLFYELSFLSKGLVILLVLVIIRTIGGCLLHASATAFTGYGYCKSLLLKKSMLTVTPYLFLAICIHAFYNFIVSFELLGSIIGIAGALLFSILCIRFIRQKIKKIDQREIEH